MKCSQGFSGASKSTPIGFFCEEGDLSGSCTSSVRGSRARLGYGTSECALLMILICYPFYCEMLKEESQTMRKDNTGKLKKNYFAKKMMLIHLDLL